MARKAPTVEEKAVHPADDPTPSAPTRRPSSLVDNRVIYCGDNLEQLAKLPDACVDLIYIDPPFNSNRNYEVFWGETKEKRAFADRLLQTHRQNHSRPDGEGYSRRIQAGHEAGVKDLP